MSSCVPGMEACVPYEKVHQVSVILLYLSFSIPYVLTYSNGFIVIWRKLCLGLFKFPDGLSLSVRNTLQLSLVSQFETFLAGLEEQRSCCPWVTFLDKPPRRASSIPHPRTASALVLPLPTRCFAGKQEDII